MHEKYFFTQFRTINDSSIIALKWLLHNLHMYKLRTIVAREALVFGSINGVQIRRRATPGLPDSSWHYLPKRGKIYQITTTLPNCHKIYQMTVAYFKWPKNIPAFSILRPSKIYPNWDFWFENKPSGNPARHSNLSLCVKGCFYKDV
jgi:hypothetical protein